MVTAAGMRAAAAYGAGAGPRIASSPCPRSLTEASAMGVSAPVWLPADRRAPGPGAGHLVRAYLPPDALRVLADARGVVPATADEPLVAS